MRGRAQRHVIYNVVAMFIVVHYSSSVDPSCDEVLCCATDGSSSTLLPGPMVPTRSQTSSS